MVIVAWVLFIFCVLSCSSAMVNEINPILRVSLAQDKEQTQSDREVDKKYVRIKNTRKVNVREKPSTNSKIIDEVSPDTIFEYLGQEGNWYQIQYDAETKAYVSAKYSVIESQSDREVDPKYVRIKNTRKVNIREKPSTNSKIIAEVSPDTVFEYLGQEGNWYQIQYDAETTAYVSIKYSVIESKSGELLQDLTESGDRESQSATTQNGDGRKNTKTCIVCKGTGRCKYCAAGRMYVGGDQMATCPFCGGSMICYMCGGLGYTP